MEENIKKATEEITGDSPEVPRVLTTLTSCALSIATVAITAMNGDLRDRAFNIAKAIVDYEDVLQGK